MKKLLLTICLVSSPVFAAETPLSAEFTAGFIPIQKAKSTSGGADTKTDLDGYYFRAALTDNKFRVFGSIQETTGSDCVGSTCAERERLETRGGFSFTALETSKFKFAPRAEYIAIASVVGNGNLNRDDDGYAIGADVILTATPLISLISGLSYTKYDQNKGLDFRLGASFKTEVINFLIEGRHLNLEGPDKSFKSKANEVMLGLQKEFSF
jgi:hypothetical protein